MKKIADGYYRINNCESISPGVHAYLTVEQIDGEILDTNVKLEGEFTVAGSTREKFLQKMADLIDEYRI